MQVNISFDFKDIINGFEVEGVLGVNAEWSSYDEAVSTIYGLNLDDIKIFANIDGDWQEVKNKDRFNQVLIDFIYSSDWIDKVNELAKDY